MLAWMYSRSLSWRSVFSAIRTERMPEGLVWGCHMSLMTSQVMRLEPRSMAFWPRSEKVLVDREGVAMEPMVDV